jgi:3-dehydroquinate dehydratase/shikimate dehydrogenase
MSSPLLCTTVAGPDMTALRRHRDAASAEGADLVELRLDLVADPDVAAALAGRRTPVIVTCRAQWEGGGFKGSEEERLAILTAALAQGAEYVDLEFKAGFDKLIRANRGRHIVLSMHDFDGVPGDLPDRVRAMRSSGAEVVKVAVQAQSLFDTLSLLDLRDEDSRSVFVGMGPCGLPTRLLPAHFGSQWTYAGDAHAPGQVPAERMLKEFRFREITERTALYGIVGYPLGHSISPSMHNAVFRAAGIDAVYVPMPAANADDFLEFAKALHVRGASVTIPYKVDLFKRVDAADQVSTQVGAVNTLKRHQTKWLGRNTDVSGFLAPLRGRVQLRGMRAAVLGAGGAARGVAVALSTSGAEVSVYARNPDRAAEISRLVNRKPTGLALPPAKSWDLIVNATPVGTFPNIEESPMPADAFDGKIAYDLVYNPPETQFLKDAAAAGCEAIGGLDMLVAQAEDQSDWWLGRRPPAGLMREAAMARL